MTIEIDSVLENHFSYLKLLISLLLEKLI